MSNLKQLKHSIIALAIGVGSLSAQSDYKETFTVSDDVVVDVNTSYTQIVFETWNKNKVEVEARIEGDNLSEEEKKEIFDAWDFNIMGNSKRVVVSSNSDNRYGGRPIAMEMIPNMDFMGPLMEELLGPMQRSFKNVKLPEKLIHGVGNIQFDYEEYQKDEKGYMKKFEKQMEKNFGKDFERDMEAWGEQFGKQFEENFGPEFEKRMEAWGEQFGKDFEQKMEAWGENFGQQMEQAFGEDGGEYSKKVITSPNGGKTIIYKSEHNSRLKEKKAKRTLIIRMPKNAKTEINVRHGEIKMADASNVRANLNYSPFTANSIDGAQTLINAAYAPVIVNNWNYGTLFVKFVEDCTIANAESINLKANSSNVKLGAISKDALLEGSFGALEIGSVSNNFERIDIRLENTDAVIHVPNTAFSFTFDGKKSGLRYPKSLQLDQQKQYDRVLVTGFNKAKNPNQLFKITANYSNVKLQ
ncbi:hypothetical protein [Cochleicola gelatinilyticus]|uniref:Uncharacterized protein n=1 Tax=Cochleicola gelatinilyticus TaxID=1763537 RepID=A0A167EQ29_9FLAO|nr:hypothetical protein [Cochleicola gelatinilyticus]OAB75763.1 hypothetical protein ULVI_14910 [Cochleicola gelatinilyticus]